MYPHKCHEPLAPCGPSGVHDSSHFSFSLSLNASFLLTHRRQIRDIHTNDYAATSVRQLTRAACGHATRCVTVYPYLHSTEYPNTAVHAYMRGQHTQHTKRFLRVSIHTFAFPHYSSTNTRYRAARSRTDGVKHPRALIVLADS